MCDSLRCNDGGRSRLSSAMRRPGGFTLVELIVVIVIISIIIVFMLNASMSALRAAQEKATQGLIAKLDSALSDRVDAILQTRVGAPTLTQGDVAQIYDGTPRPPALNSERAYVLAQVEMYQRELPDVFYVQNPSTFGYPLNFAANPFPLADGSPVTLANGPDPDAQYVLPLGTGWPYSASAQANYFNPGQGIYGASYHVAAGLYKNLGYLPTGYDGVDNNGNGRIDEWAEGVSRNGSVDSDVVALVTTNLAAHTHKTARAEVLYALLVDSEGPFGSSFNRDDFTDLEVMDTDGDGLPEFVDAWGEPLQFYRWPLFFHSELQRGQRTITGSTGSPAFAAPYDGMIGSREQDALDPNQQLLSPAWWSSSYNDAPGSSARRRSPWASRPAAAAGAPASASSSISSTRCTSRCSTRRRRRRSASSGTAARLRACSPRGGRTPASSWSCRRAPTSCPACSSTTTPPCSPTSPPIRARSRCSAWRASQPRSPTTT